MVTDYKDMLKWTLDLQAISKIKLGCYRKLKYGFLGYAKIVKTLYRRLHKKLRTSPR